MEKPFDRVDWAVMIWIFRAHGFVEEWIDILWRSVSNCHFSPMINGVASGFFKSHRGLKQDDPLSPTIFVVMADLFSRCLNRMGDRRSFSRYYLTSGCLLVTHLAYAMTCSSSVRGTRRLYPWWTSASIGAKELPGRELIR
ncbi:uncharacterized protein M6B38_281800 [Iris pallida]|uniref:Reverse transcriptase domain-containing protein n=1 Tax=Iris pallida TaxID=29817 RepID=A0AAX6I215_IRIPA|nr:uncharacterized protein M6B38_281800 [Iris pallida]